MGVFYMDNEKNKKKIDIALVILFIFWFLSVILLICSFTLKKPKKSLNHNNSTLSACSSSMLASWNEDELAFYSDNLLKSYNISDKKGHTVYQGNISRFYKNTTYYFRFIR